jgi:hypothetical protein
MKLLAQKSLKTELRLKSYKVFKFYGLDCKIAVLDCKLARLFWFLKQTQGLDFNFYKAQGAICENLRD